jgi:hypothetical protein
VVSEPRAPRRIAAKLVAFLFAGGVIGTAAIAGGKALGASIQSDQIIYAGSQPLAYPAPQQFRQSAATQLVQDDTGDSADSDEDKEVPADQLQKYINVYKMMQRDHNLTVEQATAKEGISVDAFRTLEAEIERDDTMHERVLKALKSDAAQSPAAKESKKESKESTGH